MKKPPSDYDVRNQLQNYDVTNQHQNPHGNLTCKDGAMYNSGFNQTYNIPDNFDNLNCCQVENYIKIFNAL